MSLLTYNELIGLIETGVIDALPENVNGASIDIRLAPGFKKESMMKSSTFVDMKSTNVEFELCGAEKVYLFPGEFMLCETMETFNLPGNIACEYKLKSSMARNGLQHMLAGWGDPWWHNSRMTLEFKNVTRRHAILLEAGMKIGQIVFWRGKKVPEEAGYKKRGQYNNQRGVQESKGVK